MHAFNSNTEYIPDVKQEQYKKYAEKVVIANGYIPRFILPEEMDLCN